MRVADASLRVWLVWLAPSFLLCCTTSRNVATRRLRSNAVVRTRATRAQEIGLTVPVFFYLSVAGGARYFTCG
jgi:hypothetical protein